jgi:hypothetical protein
MNSHLESLRRELESVTQQWSETAAHRAPAGKWSAAQILEHLYLTCMGTNRGIAKCLDKQSPLATQTTTAKQRVRKWVVLGLGYMPDGAKAPERTVPRGLPVGEVRAAIFQELASMDSGLDACEKRFGAAQKIMDHPILGPFTAEEWRRFHYVHGRHHTRQIQQRGKG